MKQLLVILVILTNTYLSYGQADLSTIKSHSLQLGLGSLGYMNNYFIPSGLKGINLSGIYSYKRSKSIDSTNITYINVRMDYSRLNNRYGEESLMHPTNLYYLNLNLEKLFPVYNHNNNFKLAVGFNAGINIDFCINNFYTLKSYYYTPTYGEWNTFAGLSSLFHFKLKAFTFENKFSLPCLLFGYFPEYGYSQDDINSLFYLKNLRFTSIIRYTKPENYLTVYYSGFKLKKIPGSFFISYAYINQRSDIDFNIQKYRENIFYFGFTIN